MKFPLSMVAVSLASGCAPSTPEIEVSDAWARATAPGQSSAAVYATVANRGGADRIVGVSSNAGMVMLHRSDSEGGIARMRMLSEMGIPAGGRVALAPGETHVMLSGLRTPLAIGAKFALTLRFAKAGPRSVTVAVVAAGAR